ncbi:PhzF family phenazine biosynthesis protein [Haloactinopolyspora alba]|uniref:PhzF family phenazine biosynthesis protein n=1 Tax=Haloactinopolyspora alba TaxID=648780 RepID=A0A2P8EBF8_9ACTN|nr:PhzF family phenazine biosynthesis protein [Haloactinopolyspora alba]PSL06792.1 PhzF family phenazine biosynthesis protein [Haloactinopolyspora alba]
MRISVVDAFTDRPFAGNPAGVCRLESAADPAWMQAVAAEMKHSETAFVRPADDGDADFELRWFTPETEVDLCGHATLATAHVLFDEGVAAPVRFGTRSGVLTVDRDADGVIGMDFPAHPAQETQPVPGLAEALGAEVRWTGRSRFDVLAAVHDEQTVRRLAPDVDALTRVDARGIIVTAAADEAGTDFVSRFFAPRVGVPEDPVTGSAHCVLAPYWAWALGRADGHAMTGRQLSSRGGTVRTTMHGDRVRLAGRAVTVVDGQLDGGAAHG